MGHLAEAIRQAITKTNPDVTAAMLKEAGVADYAESVLSPKVVEKAIEEMGEGVPGMDLSTQSFLKALGIGGALMIPASAIVAALTARGQSKAEERSKKLRDIHLGPGSRKVQQKLSIPNVDVPVKAAGLDKQAGALPLLLAAAVLGPAGYGYIKNLFKGRGISDALGDLFQPTGEAMSSLYGPSLMVGLPVLGAGLTHKFMGDRYEKLRKERMERETQEAEEEFQKALESEYQGAKVASDLAARVDNLAEKFTSSKLHDVLMQKAAGVGAPELDDPARISQAQQDSSWAGLGNTALGWWLAAILGLSGASAIGAHEWAKKSDKGRSRNKALMRLARRRALAGPPVFTAERRPEGEEETIDEEPI